MADDPNVDGGTQPEANHVILTRAFGRGAKNVAIFGAYGAAKGGNAIIAAPSSFSNEGGTNYQYHVLFALSVSFIFVFGTHMAAVHFGNTQETTGKIQQTLNGSSTKASLIGWGFIAAVLLAMAEFDSTASLAAAFAWLILVSVLLINGKAVLDVVNQMTSLTSTTKTTTKTTTTSPAPAATVNAQKGK